MAKTMMTREDLTARARELDITHQWIADRIGLSRQAVTDTLAGRSRHPATRREIARAVGVDPDNVQWEAP